MNILDVSFKQAVRKRNCRKWSGASLVSVPGKHLRLVAGQLDGPGPQRHLLAQKSPFGWGSARLRLTWAASVIPSPPGLRGSKGSGRPALSKPCALICPLLHARSAWRWSRCPPGQLKSRENSPPPHHGPQGWQNLGPGHCASLWGQGAFWWPLSSCFLHSRMDMDHQDSALTGSTALPPPCVPGLLSREGGQPA